MSNSDSSDEANIPPAVECERRCQEFAAITCTDTALAMYYLQDIEWNVERALETYFADTGGPSAQSGALKASDVGKALVPFTSTTVKLHSTNDAGTSDSLKRKWNESTSSSEKLSRLPSRSSDDQDAISTMGSQSQFVDDQPHRVRLLSWNIDGLDLGSIASRAKAITQTIIKEKPDIVFLQEVVSRNLTVLNAECSGSYRIIIGNPSGAPRNEGDYVVAMMLRNDTTKYISHTVFPFSASQMSRALLTVEASVKGIECTLMTSHLESTTEHAVERKNQLRTVFDRMKAVIAQHRPVLFGGDLNMRDKELSAVGGTPVGVLDVWEETGSRPEAKYTWDMTRNDNLQFPQARFKPRCRFDRLYYASGGRLKAVYFELVGLERVEGCRRFPSDHWGILSHFNKT